MSSGNWRPFVFGFNVLNDNWNQWQYENCGLQVRKKTVLDRTLIRLEIQSLKRKCVTKICFLAWIIQQENFRKCLYDTSRILFVQNYSVGNTVYHWIHRWTLKAFKAFNIDDDMWLLQKAMPFPGFIHHHRFKCLWRFLSLTKEKKVIYKRASETLGYIKSLCSYTCIAIININAINSIMIY